MQENTIWKQVHIPVRNDAKIHRIMLYVTIYCGIFMSLIFSGISFFNEDITLVEYLAQSSLFLFFVLSIILMRRRFNIPTIVPTIITLIPLFTLFLHLYSSTSASADTAYTRGIWILAIPLMSMLANLKFIVIANSVVFAFIVAIAIIPDFGYNYNMAVSMRYIGVYFVCSVFAIAYEYSKTRVYDKHIEELKNLSFTDPLTGILNRRGFLQNVKKILTQAANDRQPTSFLLIDIDDFKRINEIYGRGAGDLILCEFAKILKGFIKNPLDLLARWGGEEFCILLNGRKLKYAVDIAERIRIMTRSRIFEVNAGIGGLEEVKITCSIGCSVTDPRGKVKSLDEMFVESDLFLYRAKDLGRNRVYYSQVEYES